MIDMKITRIHHSLIFKLEKPILDFIAPRIAPHLTADQLSTLAIIGAILTSACYIAAKNQPLFLLISCVGIFIHWLGDSLDGRVAKLRNESRPVLGHYIDHMLDAVSVVIITFGLGYSGLTETSAWVWTLALFLLLMVHAFLKASVTGQFELAFEKIGPTEARMGLIVVNLLLYFTGNPLISYAPFPMKLLDAIGLVVALLFLIQLVKSLTFTIQGK